MMLAYTVGVGPVYAEMARLAAARVAELTGLPVRVLGDAELSAHISAATLRRHGLGAAAALRLRVFDIFPDADDVLYFDADVVFFRRWDPSAHAGSRELVCVRDQFWSDTIQIDARRAGVAPDRYFNSGLFIASRAHHAALFAAATARIDGGGFSDALFYEQTAFNAEVAARGVPVRWLDRRHNFLGWSWRSQAATRLPVIAAHGIARTPGAVDKQATLDALRRGERGPADGAGVDEEAEAELRGGVLELVGASGALELREDGTVGRGFTTDVLYWSVLRGASGPRLLLTSHGDVTCELEPAGGGSWRGRFPLAHAAPGSAASPAPEVARPPSWQPVPLGRRVAGRLWREARALLRSPIGRPLAKSIELRRC